MQVFQYFNSTPLNRIDITTVFSLSLVLMQGYWKYSHRYMLNLDEGKGAYGLCGSSIL